MLTPEQLTEIRRQAGRKGGLKRATQFTSESQKRARACVKRESLQAAGSKGFHSLHAKDPKAAAEKFATWRRNNPNPLVQKTISWLAGHTFELEKLIGCYYADILVNGKIVVRVNGNIWHRNDPLHGRDAETSDRLELEYYEAMGYPVVTIWEDDIVSGAAQSTLLEALSLEAVPL